MMEEIRKCWLNLEDDSSNILAFLLAMSGENYEIVGLSFRGKENSLKKLEKICDYFQVVLPIYTHQEDLEEDYFQPGSLRALETMVEDFGSVDFINFSDLDFLTEYDGELGDVFLNLDEKTEFILEGELAHKNPKEMNKILQKGQVFLLEEEAISTSKINSDEIYYSLSEKTRDFLEDLDLDLTFQEDVKSSAIKLLQSYIFRKSIIYQEKNGVFSEDPRRNGIFKEEGSTSFYLGVQGNEDFYEDFLLSFLE